MVDFDCPDLVILDVGQTLPRMRECLHRSYEHLPDGPSPGMIEEEIVEAIDKIVMCLEMRDTASQCLDDLCEEQCAHDLDFDQGQYQFAYHMRELGKDILNQCHQFQMYYGGEYLPFFFKEQLGQDAVVLQRVGYQNEQ